MTPSWPIPGSIACSLGCRRRFPIGAFSYSHGLEAAVEAGRGARPRVACKAGSPRSSTQGSGRVDADILRDAHRAAAGRRHRVAGRRQPPRRCAFRATAELALETAPRARRFWQRAVARPGQTAVSRPCNGRRASTQRAVPSPRRSARRRRAPAFRSQTRLPAICRRWRPISLSAGLRLGIIGQTDGQRILAALEPVVVRAAAAAIARDPAEFRRRDLCRRPRLDGARNPIYEAVSLMSAEARRDPLRVGIGGPVGSGKTALMDWLCKSDARPLRDRRDHQRHLHPRGRRVPDPERRACRPSASAASRPAAARIPRSARTPRSTSPRLPR